MVTELGFALMAMILPHKLGGQGIQARAGVNVIAGFYLSPKKYLWFHVVNDFVQNL